MIADRVAPRPVLAATTPFVGHVWSIDAEVVELGDGPVTRDLLRHPGAVAVMVYREPGEVLLVHQYRHPVRRELWEPPAGLLDKPDEDPWEAARRELAEEVDLTADTWHVLADVYTSPGGSSEAIRIFLARDVHPVNAAERFAREAEEAEMTSAWVSLDEVLDALAAGTVGCPTLSLGAYALDAARRGGWARLREPNVPWTARDGVPR